MGNTTRKTETKTLNQRLTAARASKQDEFYTQYVDIQKEVEAYLEFDRETFRGKVVYCNCDDPFESNFFKYFAANFNKLGLKKLVTTSYDGSPIAGQGTLFPEYNEGNGKRQKPKALATKHAVYEKQTSAAKAKNQSNCPLCAVGNDANKSRVYDFDEMDADHVAAWSKGGGSSADNCQMLCITHNRAKGNR
jgi:hypothetical protein